MNKIFTRKRLFTDDPAQLRILFFLLFAILVPVFFVGSALYLIIFKILSEQLSMPGFTPSAINPVIIKTNRSIMLGFVPLLLLLFIWGAILSHRFIGPLKRLQKELNKMAEERSSRIKLGVRENDYIKPIVNSINKLLNKLTK